MCLPPFWPLLIPVGITTPLLLVRSIARRCPAAPPCLQLKRLADWGINELRSLLPAYGGAFWALLIILATIVLVGMHSIQSMYSAAVPFGPCLCMPPLARCSKELVLMHMAAAI